MRPTLLLAWVLVLASCTTDIENKPGERGAGSKPVRWRANADCMASAPAPRGATRESLALSCADDPRGRERDFVAIALSGGGAKAAIYSAEALFYLDALGLLRRTSVVSSVSGGSFAAAVHALSCDLGDTDNAACAGGADPDLARPIWRHTDVMRTMGQGYSALVTEQVGRFAVPFIRGTIDAGRFAGYIDRNYLGARDPNGARFRFRDLNPRRPHLYLNATILSPNRGGLGGSGPETMGCWDDPPVPRGWLRRRDPDEYFHFAYSDLYFALLRSDHASFPVAGAVAASAAFPVLIDNARLVDRCRKDTDTDRTITLMDGGANDNQGMVEIYHILTETVFGQRRSDVPPGQVERLGAADTAYILVVDSSVTESTGPAGSGSDAGPIGAIGWISAVIGKIQSGVNVYSATISNLRKKGYAAEARRVEAMGGEARIRPVNIDMNGLDQYRRGGARAAAYAKSGVWRRSVDDRETDPDLPVLRRREALHSAVLRRILPAASREKLGLSGYHPQCYYDIRARLDASLLGLGEDDQNCLREAARWATALRMQELCERAGPPWNERPPDGLRCEDGLVQLTRREALGAPLELPGSCAKILDAEIRRQVTEAARRAAADNLPPPGPPGSDACQVLPPG